MNPRLKPGGAVLPGASIGVLGGGHLTRGFALEARRMGYHVVVFSTSSDDSARDISDAEVVGKFEDADAVRGFAGKVSLVTCSGTVPPAAAAAAAERAPLRPDPSVFDSIANRFAQRRFLQRLGLPAVPFRAITSLEELCRAILDLGAPALLKSSRFGGPQTRVGSLAQAEECWDAIGRQESVFEPLVSFDRELVTIGARAMDGTFACYPPFEIEKLNGLLDITSTPARIGERESRDAVDITRAIMEELNAVGIVAVGFFVTRDRLGVRRILPGLHDSGYLTADVSLTSQFEQHLRAVCGLTLASTDLLRPAAMAAVRGELWASGEPDWRAACTFPEVKLHLYGSTSPWPGRLKGHLTAVSASLEEARRLAIAARGSLTP